MITEVTFAKAKHGRESLIAYVNDKKQRVFIDVKHTDFAPAIHSVVVVDERHSIDLVIKNAYQYQIEDTKRMEIGVKKKHVWKPLLQENIEKELEIDIHELCRAKRNLSILIQRLQDILMFIEPSECGLKAYSHKLRELLILACTDLECAFKFYKLGKNERLTDYKQILKVVDLSKYKIALASYSVKYESSPFKDWKTKKLDWYDAYNKTKHNRNDAFNLATLENCLNAVCANIIMFCVRYSPYLLYNENDVCSNLVRNTFDVRIEDEADFYIPVFEGYQTHAGVFGRSVPFPNGMILEEVFDKKAQLPLIEK